ncbi:MAG: hypothetical protein A2729_05350 [Candidatus Buchananbacteria bacterium RIFCSPHIGHO2_01_FULL_39_14]|uniref:Uncharacterized protein n=1 Tax=Candidatus Buchananbacteria bacterium RIFCSPHIGHO2_01_FULL_39_14 TaxID=1797532 RepID=A0A1G1XVI5_9BACT|nr:MAG: hypothetical protein A2729_05350 [Candidatus Buchananbacteria bacterium RIFCSPHIGHO2_01_FULL_39_14]
MNDLIDKVPRYVRYDFLMVLLGVLVAYFLFTNDKVYNEQTLKILFSIISASCLIYGLLEMKENYEKDKELQEMEREYQKRKKEQELLTLRKHP